MSAHLPISREWLILSCYFYTFVHHSCSHKGQQYCYSLPINTFTTPHVSLETVQLLQLACLRIDRNTFVPTTQL